MKILIYNNKVNLIQTIIKKIKREKLIIYGSDETDLKKFNPDLVYCYNNLEIAHRCGELKIKCIHIFDMVQYRFSTMTKNITEVLIRPFNLEEIKNKKQNDMMSFTMLEELSEKLASEIKPGYYLMVNPGYVSVKDIMKYYNLEYKGNENQDNRVSEIKNKYNFLNIKTYFTEDFTQKINIYLPTYYRFEKTKKSLESLFEAGKVSKYDIKFYIGDNNTKIIEMKEWLKSIRSDDVEVHFGEKNVGKAMMVNHLSRNARDCDYIFSIDTDMVVLENQKDIFDKMIFHLTRIQNCGLIAAEQEECCQHWWGQTVDLVKRDGLEVGYSKQCIGIAGGCICLRQKDWVNVGMYKENHDIYTGDDGILTKNINKILGKDVYISKHAAMFHPPPAEDEKDYAKWKEESWKRDNLQFLKDDFRGSNQKGFYD